MLDENTVIFLKRAAFYMAEEGLDMEAAMRRVLDADQRLWQALMDRSHSEYDGIGSSYRTREGTGDVIMREMAKRIYRKLRAGADAN